MATSGFRLWFLHKLNFDGYTTLWDTIWLRPDLSFSRMRQVIAHETQHFNQMKRDGKSKFMVKYGTELVRNYIKLGNWFDAYWNVSYEIEARKVAGENG